MMRKSTAVTMALLALVSFPFGATGQSPIDRTVATPATGSVEVHNVSGEIRVSGWDRNEVRVTGRLGEGVERLDVISEGDRVQVRVVIPRGSRQVQPSILELRVPARKAVSAAGTSANVEISGITGSVDATSTSGEVRVSGSPALVSASSTSGDVVVDANTSRLEAGSTSGDVHVRGSVRESVTAATVSGDVEVSADVPEVVAKSVSGRVSVASGARRLSASSVSGEVVVRAGELQYVAIETVSGDVVLEGGATANAAINVQSHSGSVSLALPANIGATFRVNSFSGDIANDFGQRAERTSRYAPGESLSFTSGAGGAMVTVKTFSGDVRLRRR